MTALCHCIDCQKWTGGPYTSNAVVPRKSFSVTSGRFRPKLVRSLPILTITGSPKSYDAIGDSGKVNKHWFCSTCGSSLYTELEVMPDMTCVKAGSLDGGEASLGNKIGVEFYTKDRVKYLVVSCSLFLSLCCCRVDADSHCDSRSMAPSRSLNSAEEDSSK